VHVVNLGSVSGDITEDSKEVLEGLTNALNNHADALRRAAGPRTMVTNVNEAPKYPHQHADAVVLGPEIFSNTDEPSAQTVINWKGMNFVPQVTEEAEEKVKTIQEKLDMLGVPGDKVVS
jgi:hypothetical protein